MWDKHGQERAQFEKVVKTNKILKENLSALEIEFYRQIITAKGINPFVCTHEEMTVPAATAHCVKIRDMDGLVEAGHHMSVISAIPTSITGKVRSHDKSNLRRSPFNVYDNHLNESGSISRL